MRPPVYKIAHQPKPIGRWVERHFVKKGSKRSKTALYVADCVSGHGVRANRRHRLGRVRKIDPPSGQ